MNQLPHTPYSEHPATMKLNKRQQVVKSASCPIRTHHGANGRQSVSTHFLSESRTFDGEVFWTFSCHFGGRPYHNFQARPPDDMPQNVDELNVWKALQTAAQNSKVGLA